MTTATARKVLTSPRYPGWSIEKTGCDSYLLTRAGHIYAIGVGYEESHGWQGQLLTRQGGEWRRAWTPYDGAVIGAVREADRRETAISKCKQRRAGR